MRLAAPRLKSILCTHGIEVWEPLGRMRRNALRRADVILAPSKYTADHVAGTQGAATEKVKVLAWALDPYPGAAGAKRGQDSAPINFETVVLTVFKAG
jgi:hypothetical protein